MNFLRVMFFFMVSSSIPACRGARAAPDGARVKVPPPPPANFRIRGDAEG